MKILLINPSLLESEIGHYSYSLEKQRGIYPPLGLSYVASSLKRNGYQVKIIDCDAESNNLNLIKNVVKEFSPSLVGFYTMTWTFKQAKKILKLIKEINPKIKSVIGGPNVSSFPRFSLEISDFDFAIAGEGEFAINELVRALEDNTGFNQIKGLIYKDNGQVIENPSRDLEKNLDNISFPAWEELPIKKYFDVFTRNSNFATMIASRGCPFDCTFCDRQNRMGSSWRVRSPENVVKEIEYLYSKFKIREIMFFDDNFIIDNKWIYDFCDLLRNSGIKIFWECRARCDLVDKALLKTMKKAGCYRIRYGFESGDDGILKVLKKGINVSQIEECVRISKEAGIEIFAYFMMGSPQETSETLDKTLKLALKIEPDFAIFSKTILIVGSELFDWAVAHGYIDSRHWHKFLLEKETDSAPSLSTKDLQEEIVDKYVALAIRKFYFRPKYILRRILKIRSLDHFFRQTQMGFSILKEKFIDKWK